MINLDYIENKQLKEAIELNFREIIDYNPYDFEHYFKKVHKDNKVMSVDVFFKLFEEYSIKHSNLLFNVCKFILLNDKSYYDILRVPKIFFTRNKEKYIELLKISLNNSTDIFYAIHILNRIAEITNDSYFIDIANFLKNKEKDYINAQQIFSNINNIYNIKDINDNWDKYCELYYNNSIDKSNNIQEIKELLCKKIYNCSFVKMSNLYYLYILSNRKKELDKQIVFFEKIIMSTSKEELIQIYSDTISISKKFKSTYNNILKKIDIDSKKSISDLSKYIVPKNIKSKKIKNTNVDVYDISKSDFDLIIHNISRKCSFKKELNELLNNDISAWADINIGENVTISASAISNKYLGHLSRKNQEEVFFAFLNIPEVEIFCSEPHDISSNTSIKDYSKLNSFDSKGQFFLAKQLMKNSFDDYNEIVFNRYKDKTKVDKRLPNYIVCFDEINDLSVKYAEFFRIPILYINTKRCAYNNISKIEDNIKNSINCYDLLNNINEFYSFMCGLKYSDIVFEIAKLDNWENLIIENIKRVIDSINNIYEMKAALVIIGYLEINTKNFYRGLKSTFMNSKIEYYKLLDNFPNLLQQISNINKYLYNKIQAEYNFANNNETLIENRKDKKR